ncbi:hypothetical protein HNR00_000705 [Methylorubrum rhodinum]|uniref:Pectate lyase superfamily protein domain-containing protein n=1 Tax=Methylorubrum rhodinum TaxID=29428 RepID=A0A840ZEB5_9HYPH|nr:hypothetical protein [Methylorubrum rhodinum]MBB5756009.1 hypothetical protein [Methylorubrum rhodinum]
MSGSQQPGGLRVLSQGDPAMPNRAAVDNYTGPRGEPLFDGDSLRLHNGVTKGGIQLLTSALLGSAAILPDGATVTSEVSDLFGRTLTVLDRGARRNATVNAKTGAVGSTDGFDNSAVFNAVAQHCLDNDIVMVVPPGDYFCRAGITIRCAYMGAGARLVFPNNQSPANKVTIDILPGDETSIHIDEVKQWTGWTRRSRTLGNLGVGYPKKDASGNIVKDSLGEPEMVPGHGSRKGQYITVDTTEQQIMPRVRETGNTSLQFGEGFYVATDAGGLAHMLSGNATNASWTSASALAKTVRERITIEGLQVVIGDDGATTTGGSAIVNKRPNTTFRNCEINVISTREIEQGFSDERTCFVTHEDGRVTGIKVFDTNYGWNANLCAGMVYRKPHATHVRRGIDAHRSKHIDIESPHLPDGWGAHYAWWMGSRGGLVGASTSSNPQALNLAGGGFSCVDADMPITAAASSVVRGRADMMEMGDSVVLRGNRIVLDNDGDAFRLFDLQGSTRGPDNGRTVEFPRLVSFTDNTVTIHGADKVVSVVFWGYSHNATTYPKGNETNSHWHFAGNKWIFRDGNHLDGGFPRLQVKYNKNATAFGDGVSAYFADFPSLFVQTLHNTGGHNKAARFSAVIERIEDLASIRYSRGAAREIVADAPRVDMAENPYSTSLALLGGEYFAPRITSRLGITPSRFEVNLDGGTPLVVSDVANVVNRVQLTGGVAGAGPKFQATGSDSNIPMEFGTRGSGAHLFHTSFTTRQFAILHTSGAVNYPTVSGGAEGAECTLGVTGTGTTGHLALTARGPASSIRSNRPHMLFPCTFSTVPSASTFAGCSVRIVDRQHRTAVSDGGTWRWNDGNAIN